MPTGKKKLRPYAAADEKVTGSPSRRVRQIFVADFGARERMKSNQRPKSATAIEITATTLIIVFPVEKSNQGKNWEKVSMKKKKSPWKKSKKVLKNTGKKQILPVFQINTILYPQMIALLSNSNF